VTGSIVNNEVTMRVIICLFACLMLSAVVVGEDSRSEQVEKERTQRLEAWRASKEGQAALKEITVPDSRLQLRLVLDEGEAGEFDEVTDPTSGRRLRVAREVVLNEKAFASASVVMDDKTHQPRISAKLTDAGANQMEWVTSRHINHGLGIIFDKKLVMAPTIRSTIRQGLEITGGPNGLSKDQADRLVAAIQGDKK
jgi:preprotein translocase subunit SecD